MHLSSGYAKGDGAPSYFPLSTGTDRLHACNQFVGTDRSRSPLLEEVRRNARRQPCGHPHMLCQSGRHTSSDRLPTSQRSCASRRQWLALQGTSRASSVRPQPRQGRVSGMLEQLQDEIASRKSVAVGTVLSTLHEMFTQAMPTLAPHLEHAKTTLGGPPRHSPAPHPASRSSAAPNGVPSSESARPMRQRQPAPPAERSRCVRLHSPCHPTYTAP
jgi:hypothetical protein